jgi:hypothetical protein
MMTTGQLLLDLPTRRVLEEDLGGAYRRIRFSTMETHSTIPSFFEEVIPNLVQTVKILSNDEKEFKVCSHLEMAMLHKVGENEKLERIQFILKAIPLKDIDIHELPGVFEERLSQFVLRGSNFRLIEVVYLDWQLVQYHRIPFLIGAGTTGNHLRPTVNARKGGIGHITSIVAQGRCVICSKNTRNKCGKCNVRLHSSRKKNCFQVYHNS